VAFRNRSRARRWGRSRETAERRSRPPRVSRWSNAPDDRICKTGNDRARRGREAALLRDRLHSKSRDSPYSFLSSRSPTPPWFEQAPEWPLACEYVPSLHLAIAPVGSVFFGLPFVAVSGGHRRLSRPRFSTREAALLTPHNVLEPRQLGRWVPASPSAPVPRRVRESDEFRGQRGAVAEVERDPARLHPDIVVLGPSRGPRVTSASQKAVGARVVRHPHGQDELRSDRAKHPLEDGPAALEELGDVAVRRPQALQVLRLDEDHVR